MAHVVRPPSKGPTDVYQCKAYKKRLAPNDIWIELAKLCVYTFRGDYPIPRRYAFVSPLGVGTKLGDLLNFPDRLRQGLISNHFFTEAIYRKLQGNAYFGYRYDEGFVLAGNDVQIETIKDLTPGACCRAAYRLALEKALVAAGLQVKPAAPIQIAICIVGIEERETAKTLPWVMVEAYLRNAAQKKSFFIRYGAGSPRGLAAAIRLSAEMLASELQARHKLRVP